MKVFQLKEKDVVTTTKLLTSIEFPSGVVIDHGDMLNKLAEQIAIKRDTESSPFKFDELFCSSATGIELLDATLPHVKEGYYLTEYQLLSVICQIVPAECVGTILEILAEESAKIKEECVITLPHVSFPKQLRQDILALQHIKDRVKKFTETRKILQGVLNNHLNVFTVIGMRDYTDCNGVLDFKKFMSDLTNRIYSSVLGEGETTARKVKRGIGEKLPFKYKNVSLRHDQLRTIDELANTDYCDKIQRIEERFLLSLLDMCDGTRHIKVQDIIDELILSIQYVVGDEKRKSVIKAADSLLALADTLEELKDIMYNNIDIEEEANLFDMM